VARPTKYTPDRIERFLEAVRAGATFRLACQYAGIDHETYTRWRERYVDFADAVKEAEGGAVVGWLDKIDKAASDGSWQAAAWKLERRYPDDFGRRDRIDQTVEHSGKVETQVITLRIDRGDSEGDLERAADSAQTATAT
jgi:transposase